jgi:hypothetical protein
MSNIARGREEQAWMEQFRRVAPMRVVILALVMLYLSSGCGLIMIGDPVEKQDRTTEDNAEENLKAIRAILEDQATRSQRGSEHAPAPSSLPSATDPSTSMTEPPGPQPVPSMSSSSVHAEVPAKLPWSATAPERPVVPDRPVPAYTVPAPVGPDYAGSIRCVPDGMGGQRCLGR